MKLYNQNNELVTNYDKTEYKISYKENLVGTYATYTDIPEEYRKMQIRIEIEGYKVYERYGVIIPYTEEEKQDLYEKKVEKLIREKYSISQELAILRQKETKPEEFDEYNAYAEECKTKAKAVYKGD